MSDHEPRRSVRSTKGQHKSLDQLDQPAEPKKRGRKAGKRSEEQQEDTEEEIIRCVCGATEQDGDSAEPWIACDSCTAWQHNVCMGMSIYNEDLAKEYFCEQCKPANHKELLEGMGRGERPWEERRRLYEEEKANGKKRKGGRKARPKRNSDAKEGSVKPSPTPEARKEVKSVAGGKRKSRPNSEEQDVTATQRRRISDTEAITSYQPPDNLPTKITDLVDARQMPAKGLYRAIAEVLGTLQKRKEIQLPDDTTAESIAELFALQVERAVHDVHPNSKDYAAQIRTLRFNLKENHELCVRLLEATLTPTSLAGMSSDALASKELQQKTAKMKAQAERQSILETEDATPRLRRTHKGEEVIEKESLDLESEDKPSAIRRQSVRDSIDDQYSSSKAVELSTTHTQKLQHQHQHYDRLSNDKAHLDTTHQRSPKTDFDIKKVFSSVRSPATTHKRQFSQVSQSVDGPGFDPDVDRLLQYDDDESPPYSPMEDRDPDAVWKGSVSMNTVANFQATARHIGGVNLSTTIGLPWTTLVPKNLTVAGRIDEQLATEYLCSLRYSAPTDITVASLSPATNAAKADFLSLIDYFTLRKRYGVVGEKGTANVRDTYLVPLLPGTGNHPEFMMNLEDNFIPASRVAPMLLLVVVFRNDAAAMEKILGPNWVSQYATPATATPIETTVTPVTSGTALAMPTSSRAFVQPGTAELVLPSGHPLPSFSAATPQQQQQHWPTPVQTDMAAQPPINPPGDSTAHQCMPALAASKVSSTTDNAVAQREGEAVAREILGPLATCPAAGYLMSQAAKMKRSEWQYVRSIFEQHPQTQRDLQFLRRELERIPEKHTPLSAKPPQTPVPIPQVPQLPQTVVSPRSAAPAAAAPGSAQSTTAPVA